MLEPLFWVLCVLLAAVLWLADAYCRQRDIHGGGARAGGEGGRRLHGQGGQDRIADEECTLPQQQQQEQQLTVNKKIQPSRRQRKRERRQQRLQARPPSPGCAGTSTATRGPQPQRSPNKDGPPHSPPGDAISDDDTDDEESDQDDVTADIEEARSKFNPSYFRQKRKSLAPSTQTWFDLSQAPRQENSRQKASKFEGQEDRLDPRLVRSIALKKKTGKAFIYPDMKPRQEALRLLKTQPDLYKRCKLRMASAHHAFATVLSKHRSGSPQSIEIHGRSRIGQTYNEDEVAVEILPSQSGSTDAGELTGSTQGPVFGKVVGKLKRHRFADVPNPILVCVMDQHESQLMHPRCRTVPKIHVLNPEMEGRSEMEKKNKVAIFEESTLRCRKLFSVPLGHHNEFLFRVGLLRWEKGRLYPLGVVVEVLESGRDLPSGMRALELQYDVPTKFPPACVQRVTSLPPSSLEDLKRGRLDLRERLTFTIDPPGSLDLDDALSVWEEGEEGSSSSSHYVVGVHIADVTAVVEKGDEVDEEARRRGCTVYPPGAGRPHPMLPEPLSQGSCSLLPGETRPALSLLFHLDIKGQQLQQPELAASLIRSQRQLTYTQAQDIIDGRRAPGDFGEALVRAMRTLHSLATQLRRQRLQGAAWHLQWKDPRLSGQGDRGEEGARGAHALVEEFMLRTNLHVAERLMGAFPSCTLLRCQDAPGTEQLRKWLEAGGAACHFLLSLQDRKLPEGTLLSAKEYCETTPNQVLEGEHMTVRRDIWSDLLTALEKEDLEQVTSILCTDSRHPKQLLAFIRWVKLQEFAVYRCSNHPSLSAAKRSGVLEETGNGHFSLGVPAYCQCTSPIRRYADILVQRLLKAQLAGRSSPHSTEEVRTLAEKINRRQELSRSFGHSSRDLHLADRLVEQPLQVTAIVAKVSDNGLDLIIPGLSTPPQTLQEVPFNLLTLFQQPALEGEREVTCQWRRRVFHTLCNPAHRVSRSPPSARREGPVKVNESHLVATVSSGRWGGLLEVLLSGQEGRLQALRELAEAVGPYGEKDPAPGSRSNISCEDGEGKLATQAIRFQRTFAPGQAVHVQLGAGCERGMLVPRVSLLWVSDNLHLCLDHVREPVPLLAPHASRPFSSHSVHCLKDYVSTWIPLVTMEAALACAREEAGAIIESVPIAFDRERGGSFRLLTSFCTGRNLDLGGQPLYSIKERPTKVSVCAEFLCLRIPVREAGGSGRLQQTEQKTPGKGRKGNVRGRPSDAGDAVDLLSGTDTGTPTESGCLWIGHGRVVSLRRLDMDCEGEAIEVTFHLNENVAPPPPSIRTTPTVRGLVELLPVAETEGRPIEALEELRKRDGLRLEDVTKLKGKERDEKKKEREEKMKKIQATDLVRAIVLQKPVPELDEDRRRLAQESRTDLDRGPSGPPPNNRSQEEAIRKALASTFSLIQGPPGTGKTYTGMKLVYLFYKINMEMTRKGNERKQVLFCGPSNKAVDFVAKKAKQYLTTQDPCPAMVRMYGKSIEERDFPVPGKHKRRKGGADGKSDPLLGDVTLHHLIRQEGEPFAAKLAYYDRLFSSSKGTDPIELAEEVKRYNKVLGKATTEELGHYDVIFCTCSVTGNSKLVKGTDIFQVIIDECGMCPEPHCLVPVIANCASQVVLIGDHKQLKPIIRNREAADMGLETSLFERYAPKATFLNKQYRMHPALCWFPSMRFYEGKLLTGKSWVYHEANPLTLWPKPDCPHVLVHVEGEEQVLAVSTEEGNEKSCSNAEEADKVVRILQHMIEHEQVERRNVCIISQYTSQCRLLREKLEEKKQAGVKVNTVVASQGGEWDYVVFSTVRSLARSQIEENPSRGWSQRHLGFITDQNQINVALTRARKGLIIVGNSHLLAKDPVWQDLIEHYGKAGCLLDGSQFPPRVKRRRLVQEPSGWTRVGGRPGAPGPRH